MVSNTLPEKLIADNYMTITDISWLIPLFLKFLHKTNSSKLCKALSKFSFIIVICIQTLKWRVVHTMHNTKYRILNKRISYAMLSWYYTFSIRHRSVWKQHSCTKIRFY